MGDSNIDRKPGYKTFRFLIFVAGCLAVQNATAAGFYLAEVGTPTSMGTGGVANPTNTYGADASWTNPAGMTGLNRDTLLTGVQVLVPKVEFDSSTATGGGRDGGNAGEVAVIPSFFYVKRLSHRWRAGFSIVAPQGGGVDYGDDFVGRYQTSKATLAAVGFSPSIAYQVSDRFSIGAGVSIIRTKFEQNIAINQGALLPGAPDGKLRIEDATDWGYQPFLGITYHLTKRALLGVVYRAEADVDLEGDVNFRNMVISKPRTKDVEISWDNPQWLEAGLRYELDQSNHLFLNVGWQEWSEFGKKNEIAFSDDAVATLDRQWDDTWHAGLAYSHLIDIDRRRGFSVGFSYESSPAKNEHRTFDLPVDEIYKLSASYFWEGSRHLDFSLGGTLYAVGDADIDLTSQGVRSAGKFENNYILFLGGTLRYEF